MQRNNENSGALFKNDRKEKDTHPNLSGHINIEGKDYWLSGWTKRNDDGSFKVISLAAKQKEPRNQQQDRGRAFDDRTSRGNSRNREDDWS